MISGDELKAASSDEGIPRFPGTSIFSIYPQYRQSKIFVATIQFQTSPCSSNLSLGLKLDRLRLEINAVRKFQFAAIDLGEQLWRPPFGMMRCVSRVESGMLESE